MPTIIDNIELDETNVEFNYASDFVKHTDKLVYLTGKAGTGKTTFLKNLQQITTKNTVILAPTGVAAVNAGGQTIHSFFQIKPSVYVPNDKRLRTEADPDDADKSTIYDHFKYFKDRLEIIKKMELLIIDEISMVRCDLLDVVDRLLRVFRRRKNEPFGGVQVVLIGDTFQLAPIAKSDEWDILKQFYKTEFFFGAKVIEQHKPVYIELKKIYRQNEQEFIDLLNKVRINQISQVELNALNAKYNPTFSPDGNSNYITLATHNAIVDSTNLTKLAELSTELKIFEATVTGIFPDNIMPTDRLLQLKEGAQIMFIKNDRNKRFYSGKIAKIKKLDENKIIVEFSDETEISVDKEIWNNIKYSWNEKEKKIEEEVIGTFTQFPLKLAWAITVHKSQGLTFEKVIADLGAAFASGQVYVALSRCTTFSGLVLKTRINRTAIITDPEVLQFAKNETPSTLIIQELNSGKADYYYKQARDSFKTADIESAYNNLLKAIKFRNDLDTDIFKRHLLLNISRLFSYRDNSKKFAECLNKIEGEKNVLASANEVLEEASKMQKQKITDQNRSIKLSLNEIKSLELTIKNLNTLLGDLQKETESLKSEKASLKTTLIHKNREIEDLEIYIKGEEKTTTLKLNNQVEIIKRKEDEINRLRNIRWYQKLFGKK